MEKNNQQIFLQKYKVFEDWAREHFPKMQDMHYLENNYALRDYCKTLEFYRYVRNILTHYGHFSPLSQPYRNVSISSQGQ